MLNLIRHRDPARLTPYLLALTGRGPLARLAEQAGTEGTNWALPEVWNPMLLRRMRRFLMRQKYDVVQCYGLRAELLARWPARALGIPVVSSIVSINPQRGFVHTFLDRLTMDGVTAWMSTSEAAKKAYVDRVRAPENKITVIPTGIPDLPPTDLESQKKARTKWKIAEDEGPVLAVLANLRAAKGYEDLIEAVAHLQSKWPKLVCLCAGRDDSDGALQLRAKSKSVAERFRWLGFVHEAAAAVYPAADLAVLPSHWEGMPHALIEALRAGLPSIATDVGGNSEVVRHEQEGLLVPARDPVALAAALGRALSDESARRAWGDSARKRYETHFRVETMVEQMTLMYERVTNRCSSTTNSS